MAANAVQIDAQISKYFGDGVDFEYSIDEDSSEPLYSPTVTRTRLDKNGPPPMVQRSASSPNVRNLGEGDASNMSLSAEKRRNKLGYHRTSIACSHCRRRKIRCLLDDKDPHGRCSNCIRLKKECNFFPVDQQPPVERRTRNDSKAEGSSNEADVSTTSSPGRVSGNAEQVERFPSQPQYATPRSEAGWNPSYGSVAASPVGMGGTIPSSNVAEFPHSVDGNTAWDSSSYFTPSPLPIGAGKPPAEDSTPNFYPQGISPYVQTQFAVPSSTMSNPTFPQGGGNSYTVSSMPEDAGWMQNQQNQQHHGMRSVSMVGQEELPSQYPNYHYATFPAADIKRRPTNPSDLQPAPSLHNSGASSTSSTTDSHAPPSMTSFSGAQLPSQPAPYTNFPGWSAYPDPSQMTGGGHEAFGGWYGGNPQQGQHQLNAMGHLRHDESHYPEIQGNYSGPG